jgi:tetratricopeptide (TPR) repeat protein
MNRAQLAFSVLALVVVFSLVVTAVGSAVFDELTNPRTDDTIAVNPNEPDEYEKQLRDEVAANQNDAATLAALGNYLALTGRLNEAIDWYEKALAINPEAWDVRLDFARSLADSGKRADAEIQFKKVIAGNPNDPHGHYYYAELLRNWVPARNDEAATEYRRTIEVGPDTYVADLARQALSDLGYATPAASPSAPSTEATS